MCLDETQRGCAPMTEHNITSHRPDGVAMKQAVPMKCFPPRLPAFRALTSSGSGRGVDEEEEGERTNEKVNDEDG